MIKKKALMVAHVASMIDLFNMRNIEILQDMEFQVEILCNFKEGNVTSEERIIKFKKQLEERGIVYHQMSFPRSIMPLHGLINVYRELYTFIGAHKYKLIYCQGPISGVLTRFAARKTRKNGTKVIYAAHGFHFFNGSPKKNWMLFYPIEKICSNFSDRIITINTEDYMRAMNFKKKNKEKVTLIPGIGIDITKIQNIIINREEKLKNLGIPIENKIVLTVGELVPGKNHRIALEIISKLNLENVTYLICGIGKSEKDLKEKAKELHIENKVIFAGYRDDIYEIVNIADVFLFPSIREGLPVSVMEALAAGIPVVCSDIRGNRDLVQDGKGGFVIEKTNIKEFVDKVALLLKDNELNKKMGKFNKEYIKAYDMKIVDADMKKMFGEVLNI